MDRIDYSLIAGADDTGETEPTKCPYCNDVIADDKEVCDECQEFLKLDETNNENPCTK